MLTIAAIGIAPPPGLAAVGKSLLEAAQPVGKSMVEAFIATPLYQALVVPQARATMVKTATISDPDNHDSTFGSGDQITLTFTVDTLMPPVRDKWEIDLLLTFCTPCNPKCERWLMNDFDPAADDISVWSMTKCTGPCSNEYHPSSAEPTGPVIRAAAERSTARLCSARRRRG